MQSLISEPPQNPPRRINSDDAVDIWIARWLNIRRVDILRRYACDPRRLYEIWQGDRFPESRERALKVFKQRYPTLLDRIDFGNHKRFPRAAKSPDQLALFDADPPANQSR